MMMKNLKTSRTAKFKALLMVPVVALLLLAFANPPVSSQMESYDGQVVVTGNVSDRTNGKAISGSVVLIQGTTTGTVTDAKGNYRIAVENSDAVLVFSQVGFRTQLIPVGTNTKIDVLFEPDILALDFSRGNMLEIKTTSPVQDKETADSYVLVEELPSYPGGTDALHRFLISNLRYPEAARNEGIYGKVLVAYTIDTNGNITGIKILRGVSPDIDKEALRLTGLIKGWKPASQNGHSIPMTVTMPIEFRLDK